MKKILLTLCLALTLVACHSDDESEPAVVYDETFLIYMPWSYNLTPYLRQNISSMKRAIVNAKGLGTKRLVVFFADDDKKSCLYEIKYSNGTCYNDTLKKYTFSQTNYTTVEGLSTVLQDVKTATKTGKYSMIIGCHGSGWIPAGRKLNARRKVFGTPLGKYPEYQTEISTLATAIINTDMPMEFVLFDDCYMAGIEIAYELRNATHYLIASTCEIMDVGIPYDKCFFPLLSHNYVAACDAFYDFYNSYKKNPYGTLSVTDCKQVEPMASIMKQINKKYTFNTEKLSEVQALDGCSKTIFFDLGSYVENLVTDSKDPLLLEFRSKLIELVTYYIHTKEYISFLINRSSGTKYPIKTYSGITISDATENQDVANDKFNTPWWIATH